MLGFVCVSIRERMVKYSALRVVVQIHIFQDSFLAAKRLDSKLKGGIAVSCPRDDIQESLEFYNIFIHLIK